MQPGRDRAREGIHGDAPRGGVGIYGGDGGVRSVAMNSNTAAGSVAMNSFASAITATLHAAVLGYMAALHAAVLGYMAGTAVYGPKLSAMQRSAATPSATQG